MKMVQFTKDMAPHKAGEQRAVFDDVAERLATAGEAKIVPSVFDDQRAAEEPKRRKLTLSRRT